VSGDEPLLAAALSGKDREVTDILKAAKINLVGVVKFKNLEAEGVTALWMAAAGGHLKVVKILISAGGQVDHPAKFVIFTRQEHAAGLFFTFSLLHIIPVKYS